MVLFPPRGYRIKPTHNKAHPQSSSRPLRGAIPRNRPGSQTMPECRFNKSNATSKKQRVGCGVRIVCRSEKKRKKERVRGAVEHVDILSVLFPPRGYRIKPTHNQKNILVAAQFVMCCTGRVTGRVKSGLLCTEGSDGGQRPTGAVRLMGWGLGVGAEAET